MRRINNSNKSKQETKNKTDTNINFITLKYQSQFPGVVPLFNKKYLDYVSSMILDGQKINISNSYNLPVGEHNITIEFNKSLESTAEMFANCSRLKEISFDNFETQNINNISQMFYRYTGLISFNLTGFDTEKLQI